MDREELELSADKVKASIRRVLSPIGSVYPTCPPNLFSELRRIKRQAEELAHRDAWVASQVYEYFISMMHKREAWHPLHTEAGLQMASEICGGWVRARQQSRAKPSETIGTILRWLTGVTAAERTAAFAPHLDADLAAGLERGLIANISGSQDGWREEWGSALSEFYRSRQMVQEYIELAQKNGVSSGDCRVAGELLLAKGNPAEALVWVDRGLAMKPDGTERHGELESVRRSILAKLGRVDEALDSAWESFLEQITPGGFKEVLAYAPVGALDNWRAHALAEAQRHAAQGGFELLCAERACPQLRAMLEQQDPALRRVRIELLSEAARVLRASDPWAAAEYHLLAAILRLDAARTGMQQPLESLSAAKACYREAGATAAWEARVEEVRARYGSRVSFMKRFDKLAQERY